MSECCRDRRCERHARNVLDPLEPEIELRIVANLAGREGKGHGAARGEPVDRTLANEGNPPGNLGKTKDDRLIDDVDVVLATSVESHVIQGDARELLANDREMDLARRVNHQTASSRRP